MINCIIYGCSFLTLANKRKNENSRTWQIIWSERLRYYYFHWFMLTFISFSAPHFFSHLLFILTLLVSCFLCCSGLRLWVCVCITQQKYDSLRVHFGSFATVSYFHRIFMNYMNVIQRYAHSMNSKWIDQKAKRNVKKKLFCAQSARKKNWSSFSIARLLFVIVIHASRWLFRCTLRMCICRSLCLRVCVIKLHNTRKNRFGIQLNGACEPTTIKIVDEVDKYKCTEIDQKMESVEEMREREKNMYMAQTHEWEKNSGKNKDKVDWFTEREIVETSKRERQRWEWMKIAKKNSSSNNDNDKRITRWTLNLVLYFDFPIGWFWIDNINSVRFVRFYVIHRNVNVMHEEGWQWNSCVRRALYNEKWITIEFQCNRISHFIFNMCLNMETHTHISTANSREQSDCCGFSFIVELSFQFTRKVWCVLNGWLKHKPHFAFTSNFTFVSLIDFENKHTICC